MALIFLNSWSTCSVNTCVCVRDLLFRRLSRLPRGANQPADYLIHRLFPMTQSAAKASMAIADDDHPSPDVWDRPLTKKHGVWVFRIEQPCPPLPRIRCCNRFVKNTIWLSSATSNEEVS